MVETGQKAPDFIAPALVDGEGRMLELFKLLQTNEALVLYFHPADFVPECTAELRAVQDAGWPNAPEFAVLSLSGDSLFSHAAYAEQNGFRFPMVTDFHGGIADSYGLLAAEWEAHSRIPKRAAVVIGGDWTVEAIETAADPLQRRVPGPVERAAETLDSLGIDVNYPRVDYESVS